MVPVLLLLAVSWSVNAVSWLKAKLTFLLMCAVCAVCADVRCVRSVCSYLGQSWEHEYHINFII